MNKNLMYSDKDYLRMYDEGASTSNDHYRSAFSRDYARLVHSPSFRRLQGKTQLFPGNESDFFRNRLTHSIEVAQIAISITNRLNSILRSKYTKRKYSIDKDLVQFAALAHDLGHPPFGHQGETALDKLMEDFGGFEGNAQTLKILTRLEKKRKDDDTDDYGMCSDGSDGRFGLNLTARSIASVLKYNYKIPITYEQRQEDIDKGINTIGKKNPCKGYYETESKIIDWVKSKVIRNQSSRFSFQTVEMQIMDLADDIAYSTYDFEDSLKSGFINFLDLSISGHVMERIANEVNKKLKVSITTEQVNEITFGFVNSIIPDLVIDESVEDGDIKEYITDGTLPVILAGLAYRQSKNIAKNGYDRTAITSSWVDKFVNCVDIELNEGDPALSKVLFNGSNGDIENNVRIQIEVLKRFTYEFQINSNKLKIIESRGMDIVKTIFESIEKSEGAFLPDDFGHIYHIINKNISDVTERKKMLRRTICDFVACMTDKYAVQFYGRLKSENPQSIFISI